MSIRHRLKKIEQFYRQSTLQQAIVHYHKTGELPEHNPDAAAICIRIKQALAAMKALREH